MGACCIILHIEIHWTMKTKKTYLTYAMVGCVSAVLIGFLAFSHKTGEWSELGAFVSAIAAGVSLILAIISLYSSKVTNERRRYIYVSTPFNLSKDLLSKIKSAFKGYPVFYTDDIFDPGDIVTTLMKDNMKNVSYCFMIISGDLTPRQKNEIKELKRNGARITPVINGDDTKIPTVLQDYQPVSMETFLSMGKKTD